MAAIYNYSILTDFSGGVFNSAIQTRLTQLIGHDILTPLSSIQVVTGQNLVRINFSDTLTPAEKTILDGNVLAPAGGLIAASTDKYGVLVDGVLKTDNTRLNIPADRVTFKTITLQKQAWNGTPKMGTQEIVSLEPSSIGAISILDGNLNAVGEFNFILGPDVRRGVMNISIGVQYFSSKNLAVRFF